MSEEHRLNSRDSNGDQTDSQGEICPEEPSSYRVLMRSNDFAPMEFVAQVLRRIFHMSQEQATRSVLKVRSCGEAICGVYRYEIAETKASEAVLYARTRGHSLRMSLEKN